MNGFLVASTARRPDKDAPDHLFVGELMPHNAERPWLVIRGACATVLAVPEPVDVAPDQKS